MREIPNLEVWVTKEQIMLLMAYGTLILKTAHEISLAGHLGVSKSYKKIVRHFYWLELKKDVAVL